MLVPSGRNDHSVVIGGSDHCEHMVKVTVLEISGGSVMLGCEANRDVGVTVRCLTVSQGVEK